MKNQKIFFLTALFCLCLAVFSYTLLTNSIVKAVPIPMVIPTSDSTFFNVPPTNKQYLQYYNITNTFDSAGVEYNVGEFEIVSSISTKIGIPIRNDQPFQDNTTGESSVIAGRTQTNGFILPTNASISFFRSISVFPLPNNQQSVLNGSSPIPSSHYDISDTTEFVINVVRVSDNAVLFSIDSVGVLPTITPATDSRYGNETSTIKHISSIPSQYAGDTVFIRISARRNGNSAYGLILRQYSEWMNYTARVDSLGNMALTQARIDSIRSQYFTNVLSYCTTIKNSTGTLPREYYEWYSSAESETFMNLFFDAHTSNGNTYYTEKTSLSKRALSDEESPNIFVRYKPLPAFFVKSVYPNPISEEAFTSSIYCSRNFIGSIELYNAKGISVGTLWKGILSKGESSIRIDLSSLKVGSGSYFLVIKETGEIVGGSVFNITIVR